MTAGGASGVTPSSRAALCRSPSSSRDGVSHRPRSRASSPPVGAPGARAAGERAPRTARSATASETPQRPGAGAAPSSSRPRETSASMRASRRGSAAVAPGAGGARIDRAIARLEGVELGVAVRTRTTTSSSAPSARRPPRPPAPQGPRTRAGAWMRAADSRPGVAETSVLPVVRGSTCPSWSSPVRSVRRQGSAERMLHALREGNQANEPRVGEVHRLGRSPGSGAPLRAPALPGGRPGRHRRRESAGPGGHAGAWRGGAAASSTRARSTCRRSRTSTPSSSGRTGRWAG